MKALLKVLTASMALCSVPAAGSSMSKEEATVRTTYAKVAFASQLAVMQKVIDEPADPSDSELRDRVSREALQFRIENVRYGPIAEIAAIPYSTVVTKPNGNFVLEITQKTTTKIENDVDLITETSAVPKWERGQDLASNENWNVPVVDVLKVIEHGQEFDRYVAYDVTVTFGARSRTSQGIFFFGKQKSGNDLILPIDMVTGNSAISAFLNKSVYPAALVARTRQGNSAVKRWLHSAESSSATCKEAGQVCCDTASLVCEIAPPTPTQGDARRVSKPISTNAPSNLAFWPGPEFVRAIYSPEPSLFLAACEDYNLDRGPYVSEDHDNVQHISGDHVLFVVNRGTCTYEGETGWCDGHATATASASMGESGASPDPVMSKALVQRTGWQTVLRLQHQPLVLER